MNVGAKQNSANQSTVFFYENNVRSIHDMLYRYKKGTWNIKYLWKTQ